MNCCVRALKLYTALPIPSKATEEQRDFIVKPAYPYLLRLPSIRQTFLISYKRLTPPFKNS